MCFLYALPNTAKRNPVLAKIVPNQLENAVDMLLPDSLEAVLDKAASKASSALQAADDVTHAGWFSIPADQCLQQEADVNVYLFVHLIIVFVDCPSINAIGVVPPGGGPRNISVGMHRQQQQHRARRIAHTPSLLHKQNNGLLGKCMFNVL